MPRLGSSARLDPGVQLNVLSGRALRRVKPLQVGTHARLRSGTVLYAHSSIGDYFETGHHVVVREENRIGSHVSVWNNTTIDYGCRIGDHVKIHANCYIAQYSILEDHVFLAPGVILANDPYPGNPHASRVLQGPLIKKGAQIGINCTILPGVVIGENALVGSGSVVTRDVPPGRAVWGNPARVQKTTKELRWPDRLSHLHNRDAEQYYRKHCAGKRVY